MKVHVVFTFCFLGLVCLAFSQVTKISLTDLILQSDIIVKAKVENTEARWVTDERGKHIYTVASLRADTPVKGRLSKDEFAIEVIGGTVGEVTEYVTHSYSFKKGEEVILFLKSNPIRVLGGFQGKYTIYDGKIYVGNKEVKLDKFVHAIQTFINDPTRTLSFNKEPQLKVEPGSLKKQGEEAVQSQERPKLRIDEGSLKKSKQDTTQQQPQLKVEPSSLKKGEEAAKPQEQPKLKVDEGSLKKSKQDTTQQQPQLKVEPSSLKKKGGAR